MTPNTTGTRTRRRAMAAASGLAALALALSACGDDSAEDTAASATSAVASAATEATSAVGSAAAEATSAVAEAGDDERDDERDDHDGDHEEKDRAFLDEVRAGGVDVGDDEDFIIRGHDACRDLEDGESADVVINKYYEAHPEAGQTEGETVVTAAVNAFCPDYAPALNN